MPARDPLARFHAWYRRAARHPRVRLPMAMCLSTVDAQGRPQARFVLLKHADARGFVFYTDARSPKGRALRARPRAALAFYWEPLRRQIRIEGLVASVPARDADAYFATRPRGSQLAAWASVQSAPLADRRLLLARARRWALRFRGRPIPRPPYWQGFRLVPRRIEFWAERPSRMHDRWLWTRRGGRWASTRLSP